MNIFILAMNFFSIRSISFLLHFLLLLCCYSSFFFSVRSLSLVLAHSIIPFFFWSCIVLLFIEMHSYRLPHNFTLGFSSVARERQLDRIGSMHEIDDHDWNIVLCPVHCTVQFTHTLTLTVCCACWKCNSVKSIKKTYIYRVGSMYVSLTVKHIPLASELSESSRDTKRFDILHWCRQCNVIVLLRPM